MSMYTRNSMYTKNMLFTSESVTEGHPNKSCGQISDAVLDECLQRGLLARVARECYVTMGLLIVGGEVTNTPMFDIAELARNVENEFGKTVEYQNCKPVRVENVLIAASHTAAVVNREGKYTTEEVKEQIINKVVQPLVGDFMEAKIRVTVNGTGKFLVGGPLCDNWLKGRKIVVDPNGGWSVHGGGASSGKDPAKVDRSVGYKARSIAKKIVATGLAEECLVQVW